MKVRLIGSIVMLSAICVADARAIAQNADGRVPAEINITSDSERGWLPLDTQQQRALEVKWSKNPASTTLPRIYASVDVAARYADADRSCGYVILDQKSPDDRFEVMQRDNNIMSNKLADRIERENCCTLSE